MVQDSSAFRASEIKLSCFIKVYPDDYRRILEEPKDKEKDNLPNEADIVSETIVADGN